MPMTWCSGNVKCRQVSHYGNFGQRNGHIVCDIASYCYRQHERRTRHRNVTTIRTIWRIHGISLATKVKLLKALVWPLQCGL